MAKPKLALIPAAQGTKFYSVLPSDGVGDFTFNRGSVATRINAQGLIENVASGVSRLDYPMIDGVQKGCPHHILEPARTNLIQYSESFSNAAWSKEDLTVTSNQTISPDGSLNADLLLPNTNNTDHSIYDQTSATTEAFSVFLKAGGYNYAFVGENNAADTNGVFFDLINGTVNKNTSSFSASIKDYGNGWFRCTLSGSFTYTFRIICPSENGQSFIFAGDGVKGVYSWGAQVESGSFPTSYIPNNGNAAGVTRSAETANGAGNATTFNDSEGVLMAEISALANDLTFRNITISDGSNSNIIQLRYRSTSNVLQALLYVGGVGETYGVTLNDITTFSKVLIKYKENDVSFWVNGFERISDTLASTFPNGTLNTLRFERGDGAFDFYGNTKQLQYFDTALADTQLEQLTSWQSFRDMANGQLYTIE
jgi:hypothetical protein